MSPADTASRLCAACGLCCNGVLFFGAQLQPGDSARKLEKLGLKVKRREGQLIMLQPCTAHREMSCRVYADRPTRCRLFACRQLLAVEAGERTAEEALATIGSALAQVERVKDLLREAGDSREHKALQTRHESVFTEPLDETRAAAREMLRTAMAELDGTLQNHFHPPCPS